jgi:phosphonate transport system ATP-binding protein
VILLEGSIEEIFRTPSGFDIKLDNVSVAASSTPILHDINLEIKKGETVAVLGRSGAGKSTLLRTIAGLIKPSKNTVLFNSIDFFSLGKKEELMLRRMIGYIPQQFKLIKESSVFENVMIGRLGHMSTAASLLHRYPEKDQKLVLDCISKVGLTGKEGIPTKKLSGGEQQRVAIARCLAQEPSVILPDEPMASLDVSLATTILEILHNENIEKGKTAIFVMHDIEMARRYAKRIILMKNGRVVSDGSSEEMDENTISKVLFD